MKITMKKDHVLKILKEHKEAHVAEYEVQIKGWQDKMAEWNKKMDEWSSGRGVKRQPQQPAKPQRFVKEYDAWIKKITYHVLDTVVLDDHDYNQVIEDQFNWSSMFMSNSSTYGTLASASVVKDDEE